MKQEPGNASSQESPGFSRGEEVNALVPLHVPTTGDGDLYVQFDIDYTPRRGLRATCGVVGLANGFIRRRLGSPMHAPQYRLHLLASKDMQRYSAKRFATFTAAVLGDIARGQSPALDAALAEIADHARAGMIEL